MCVKCKEEKDIDCFGVSYQRNKIYKKQSCKECEHKRVTDYKHSRKDIINKCQKIWRENNSSKLKNWRKISK